MMGRGGVKTTLYIINEYMGGPLAQPKNPFSLQLRKLGLPNSKKISVLVLFSTKVRQKYIISISFFIVNYGLKAATNIKVSLCNLRITHDCFRPIKHCP